MFIIHEWYFFLFNRLVKFLKSKIETAQDGNNACESIIFTYHETELKFDKLS